MPSIRSLITFAIPAVTAFFGFLWIISKKKPPERKKVTSGKKDDTKTSASNESNHTIQTSRDEHNSAADAVNVVSQIEELFIDGSGDAAHLPRDTESLLDSPVAADTEAKKESHHETLSRPGNSKADDLASDLSPEISEQLIESRSIVAESAPVTESMIHSENVSKTSVKPPEQSTTDLHPNNDSSSMANIEDSLISQIICSDTNTDSDSKNKESDDQKQVTAEVCEKMTSEVNNSVTISPEINSQNTIASNHASLSQDSDKITSKPQQSSSETRLQNDLLELEKEKTSETSQMSRSWHEELEESEKTALNGPSKLEGEDVNSSKSDKKMEKVSNNTKEEKNLINKSVSNRVSSKDRTSLSPSSKSSSPVSRSGKSRKDDSQNHSETSSNCDNSSEASNDSGKGGSVGEKEQPYVDQDRLFEFNIPSDMCGLFIGSRGKTIRSITEQSGARIHVKENPYTRNFQICVIEGTEAVIDRACSIIKRKFPTISMPGIDLNTPNNTVIMPEIMQLNLPEGVSIDVVVSSIVDAGRVFLQQPTHPTFPSLERLNSFMNQCYHHDGTVPDLPKSGIESGVICAAPMLNGWYRAQIIVYNEDTDECDIKYVDYGGYSRIASRCLKQIRSDFMTLPFEAVECYLANITPLDNESYFSSESAVILEELTQGKMLQAQVVGKADNGLPYVHIYQISGPNQTLLINRELVNRGVVRWLELMS